MRDGWWILVGIGLLVWLFSGRKAGDSRPSSSQQQQPITLLDTPPPLPKRPRTRASAAPPRWIEAGETCRIHDFDLSAGLIYVGSAPRSNSYGPDRQFAHVIDPGIRIDAARADASGQSMPYWPSYAEINPQARRGYLLWLASGRRDPAAGIGHVFLFFYGLEHRIFVDRALHNAPVIVDEVRALLSVYGEQSSFRTYASRFLDAVAILTGAIPDTPPQQPLPRSYEFPQLLQCALGRRLTQGRLTGDWLLAWAMAHPETNLRTPATRCYDEFRQLFLMRFEREYPQGLAVRIPAKKLQFAYSPATGGASLALPGAHTAWPDPTALTAPLKTASALIADCTSALDGYSRFLGRNPAKRGSLAAHGLLPPELRGSSMQGFDAIRTKLDSLTPNGVGETTIGTLLSDLQISTDPTRRPSANDLTLLSTGLQSLGFGMEPDPRFGGKMAGITTPVLLFRARDGANVDPARPAYVAARMLVEIAAVAATIDAENVVAGLGHVQSEITNLADLTGDERLRLLAYLASFRRTGPNPKLALQKLAALPANQRERIARVALGALVADRRVGADEVAFAERLYRALGLPANQLYSDLHSAHGSDVIATNELPQVAPSDPGRKGTRLPPPPITTRSAPPPRIAPVPSAITFDPGQLAEARRNAEAVRRQLGTDEPILTPPADHPSVPSPVSPPAARKSDPPAIVIDVAALARKRQETDAVRLLLTDVFADDTDQTDAIQSADEEPFAGPAAPSATDRYVGLDADHAVVVDLMIARHGRIPRVELETAIAARGLFFDGALESINDWAFGRFNEPLIEDGDPCVAPAHLLSQLHQFA